MSFPRHLRKSLDLSGLTQSALSRRTGISQASLSRYLNGHVMPSRDVVVALGEALGVGEDVVTAWENHINGGELPHFLRDIGRLEEMAARVDLIGPVAVPGLLWCLEYARLVFRSGQPLLSEDHVERLARLRSARLEQLTAHVSAVFPMTALTGVPDDVGRAQAQHLLDLPERVSLHLVPEGSILLGVTSPLMMFRLVDGRQVATSDHVDGNAIYSDSVLPRISELVRNALALSLPHMATRDVLEGLAR
ncbi:MULTISPECIES: helix-turn-helix domain-containing protein [Nocardiopsis]|uniref:Transcriptional regulator with XRE-family HTH domain n=1 Tax=Nocardiopsis aegyptia TaxID=220378 RepID=A0A7Z0EJM2_9ACTN|nr:MULTISPECIES: helix-turn-helix transcriptional regulator [Nocardiopsis]KOX12467.1 hypothetical protein ADL05_21555 [Nocardiopsis sp. NRRL B-16309]NYJ33084.1 transcriptional regulator with XRE-family HTH domain [Nocardiopsis aegyptia]